MFEQIMFGRSYEKDKPLGVTSMITLETSPVEGSWMQDAAKVILLLPPRGRCGHKSEGRNNILRKKNLKE